MAVLLALRFDPILASCAVIVVPILVPNMMATLPSKLSSPWLARAMVMPTAALELCMTMVRAVPASTPRRISLKF